MLTSRLAPGDWPAGARRPAQTETGAEAGAEAVAEAEVEVEARARVGAGSLGGATSCRPAGADCACRVAANGGRPAALRASLRPCRPSLGPDRIGSDRNRAERSRGQTGRGLLPAARLAPREFARTWLELETCSAPGPTFNFRRAGHLRNAHRGRPHLPPPSSNRAAAGQNKVATTS